MMASACWYHDVLTVVQSIGIGGAVVIKSSMYISDRLRTLPNSVLRCWIALRLLCNVTIGNEYARVKTSPAPLSPKTPTSDITSKGTSGSSNDSTLVTLRRHLSVCRMNWL